MISWAFVDTLAIIPAVSSLQRQTLSDASAWSRLLARCSYFPSLTLRSHTVQLFGLTAYQKIFIPSIGKHRFTRAAFQSLALTEKCYQSVTQLRFTCVPTVWKAFRGNDLPHTITSFLTHLCFIRNSISAVNFLSPTCFIVDRSWLVLKAHVCFSMQRVQGPTLAGGLHYIRYIRAPGFHPVCCTYVSGQVLCVADGSLISWFVTTTAMHWERVLVSCFYRSPAAGITKRAHLNTSVTLYLSSPDYRHNATVSWLWQLNWHLPVIMQLLWSSWKIAMNFILVLQVCAVRNHQALICCSCLLQGHKQLTLN